MLFSLIQQIFFFSCSFWLRYHARSRDTNVEETTMVFALEPKELQSTEHDLWGPCSTWWDFLSQHVPSALSSSSDPSPVHREVSTSELAVEREEKEEGMMSGYNKSDFLAFSSRPSKAKINKTSHDPHPPSKISNSSSTGGFFSFITIDAGK